MTAPEPATSTSPENGSIALDGSTVGAAMSVQLCPSAGLDHKCCCINIYVNNNVQGATNCVLSGSKVVMRDAGVRFYFPQHHGNMGTDASSNKKLKRRQGLQCLVRGPCSLFLPLMVVLLVCICFAPRCWRCS